MPSLCGLPAMAMKQTWESGSRDFFRTQAKLPLSETFLMIGSRCRLSTNSESILSFAHSLFASMPAGGRQPDVEFKFWVDRTAVAEQSPRPKPYFRGQGRFVFAGFDDANSILVDLQRHMVIGRFTSPFAEDSSIWKKVVFPILPAFLGSAIPIAIIRGACVELEGRGLLLVGPIGAGKSTLAWQLGKGGFNYLSDDRTYLSSRNGRLFAWSVGGFLKLHRHPGNSQPTVDSESPSPQIPGSEYLELDPETELGFRRSKFCELHTLVFLERMIDRQQGLRPLGATELLAQLERSLNSDTDNAAFQQDVVRGLAELPSYTLNNVGPPEEVAHALRELVGRPAVVTAQSWNLPVKPFSKVNASSGDPIRRETALEHSLAVNIMGRTGRILTNSAFVLETLRTLFQWNAPAGNGECAFTWRIVCEADGDVSRPWPQSTAFSSGTLRFVNMGQRSFIATDLESAEVVGFVSAKLASNEPGFAAIFLAAMFNMTVPALGMVPLKAACLAKDDKGLLLLGPPHSGKTTCAYLCSKFGLEYRADMAAFLESEGVAVRAWGEFWPALFHDSAHELFPELRFLAKKLEHRRETFLSLEKTLLSHQPARPVEVALSVVLERGVNGSPKMRRLDRREHWDALLASSPYEEVELAKDHQIDVLAKLSRVPAYQITFGKDPAEAAMFCRSLMAAQDILKAVP